MKDTTGKQGQRYYVGGRCYCPDVSTPLCCHKGIFEAVTLYQSPNGAFFTVRESTVDGLGIDGAAVEVLSKTAARSFMDRHTAGIEIDNYNRLFGEPKQG